MKVLLIGDSHLDINHFELTKQFLAWLNQVISQTKPDLVVNLGDTFDKHANLRTEILTEFDNHIQHVYAEGIQYVYLLGNHDQYKPKDAKYHALQTFRNRKHLYIVDEIRDLFGMTFVPYQINPSLFPTCTLPICIAHQTFKGADFGSIATKDGVDAGTVTGAELIISGHIHTRHTIPPRNGQGATVSYPGSPFSQSSDDIDQIKGLTIFDTETYEEQFIICPLPRWRGARFELDQTFGVDDLYEELSANIKESKDHWTIQLSGTKTEILGYLNSDRHKNLVKGIDVNIKPNYSDKEKRKLRIEARSMDNIVSDYILKVYSGSLDKDVLLSKALELINQSALEQ